MGLFVENGYDDRELEYSLSLLTFHVWGWYEYNERLGSLNLVWEQVEVN